MFSLNPRRVRLGALVLVALPAVALAGCGTTEIDNKKAEQLIRTDLAKGVSAKSVSCPSGIVAKAGTTFTCNVTLVRASDGSVHNGTITVHITNSSGRIGISGSDFHIQ